MQKNGDLVLRLRKSFGKSGPAWQPGPTTGTFQIVLKAGSVRVGTRESSVDEEIDIVFHVYNDKSRLVDEFTDRDLSDNLRKPNNNETWYVICKAVFDDARRKAMNAESVIEKIIAELPGDLDDDIPF